MVDKDIHINIGTGVGSQKGDALDLSRCWMKNFSTSEMYKDPLSPNQQASVTAMIAYISDKLGTNEFDIERRLSDRFNIPNPKLLPASNYDEAIRYLADIV